MHNPIIPFRDPSRYAEDIGISILKFEDAFEYEIEQEDWKRRCEDEELHVHAAIEAFDPEFNNSMEEEDENEDFWIDPAGGCHYNNDYDPASLYE